MLEGKLDISAVFKQYRIIFQLFVDMIINQELINRRYIFFRRAVAKSVLQSGDRLNNLFSRFVNQRKLNLSFFVHLHAEAIGIFREILLPFLRTEIPHQSVVFKSCRLLGSDFGKTRFHVPHQTLGRKAVCTNIKHRTDSNHQRLVFNRLTLIFKNGNTVLFQTASHQLFIRLSVSVNDGDITAPVFFLPYQPFYSSGNKVTFLPCVRRFDKMNTSAFLFAFGRIRFGIGREEVFFKVRKLCICARGKSRTSRRQINRLSDTAKVLFGKASDLSDHIVDNGERT